MASQKDAPLSEHLRVEAEKLSRAYGAGPVSELLLTAADGLTALQSTVHRLEAEKGELEKRVETYQEAERLSVENGNRAWAEVARVTENYQGACRMINTLQNTDLRRECADLETKLQSLRQTFEVSSTDEENRMRAENESLKAQLTALSSATAEQPVRYEPFEDQRTGEPLFKPVPRAATAEQRRQDFEAGWNSAQGFTYVSDCPEAQQGRTHNFTAYLASEGEK